MWALGRQLSQALLDVAGVLTDRVKRTVDIVANIRRTLVLTLKVNSPRCRWQGGAHPVLAIRSMAVDGCAFVYEFFMSWVRLEVLEVVFLTYACHRAGIFQG